MPSRPTQKEKLTPTEARVYARPYLEKITPAQRWGSAPAKAIDLYRTDPKTGKLESLAHKYDIGFSGATDEAAMRQPIDPGMLHALHDAQKINPKLSVKPEEMVAILAQEGRTDFGGNDIAPKYFEHNKKSVELYNKLRDMGYDEMQAGMPALMLEKQRVANVKKIPWPIAWNGTGVTEGGRTGEDYIREYNLNLGNVKKNPDVLKAFTEHMSEPAKPKTVEDWNTKDFLARRKMVDKARADMIAKGATDQEAQAAFPDAPIPFPNTPNLAFDQLKEKYAVGGLVGKYAKIIKALDEAAPAVKKTEIFIGPRSAAWDADAHALAVKMEDEGASPSKIWQQTGNWRMPDKNWAQEIIDPIDLYNEEKGIKYAKDTVKAFNANRVEDQKAYEDAGKIGTLFQDLKKTTDNPFVMRHPETNSIMYNGSTGQPLIEPGFDQEAAAFHDSLRQKAIEQFAEKYGYPASEKAVHYYNTVPYSSNIWYGENLKQPKRVSTVNWASPSGPVKIPMKEVIDHPELLDAYPNIGNIAFYKKTMSPGAHGVYSPTFESIGLSKAALNPSSTLAHELQHAVQKIEGWEGGANPKDFPGYSTNAKMALYYRNLGEAVARATQARRGLLTTEAERRAVFPETSLNIPGTKDLSTEDIKSQLMWQGMDPLEKTKALKTALRRPSSESVMYDSDKVQSIVDDLKASINEPPQKFAIGGVVKSIMKGATALKDMEAVAGEAEEAKRLAKIAKSTNIIKEPGGNWLSGPWGNKVVRNTAFEYPESAIEPYLHDLNPQPLNNWIQNKLVRYIKNDLGTNRDEVRKLFDQGIKHYQPRQLNSLEQGNLDLARRNAGMPEENLATTDLGKKWEDAADNSILGLSASRYIDTFNKYDESKAFENNPWLTKIPTNARVHTITSNLMTDLGFDSLISDLRSATIEGGDLPPHLKLDPNKLDKVTVPQAVQLSSKINDWRTQQKLLRDQTSNKNISLVTHKEYPNGYKWVEITHKKPEEIDLPSGTKIVPGAEFDELQVPGEGAFPIYHGGNPNNTKALEIATRRAKKDVSARALRDAFRAEGDIMQNCLKTGAYCDPVMSGDSRIFSLRDEKGEPHVSIEVNQDYPALRDWEDIDPKLKETYLDTIDQYFKDYPNYKTSDLSPREVNDILKEYKAPRPLHSIRQIRGKNNAAPADQYQPYVQDFVKSGNWADVQDLENARLSTLDDHDYDDAGMAIMQLRERMKEAGTTPDQKYFTEQELRDLMDQYGIEQNFAQGGLVASPAQIGYNPQTVQSIVDQLHQEMLNG